jgi:hypothetical protein
VALPLKFSVEYIAPQAYEYDSEVVIAGDAATGRTAEMHIFAVKIVVPLIRRVVKGAKIDLIH